VWVLVGVSLVFLGLAALRPVMSQIELRTRLAVAEQNLITYRSAVLAYSAEKSVEIDTPPHPIQKQGEQDAAAQKEKVKEKEGAGTVHGSGKSDEPEIQTKETLGDKLVSMKKLDVISFPLGDRVSNALQSPSQDPWQPDRPEIRTVSLPVLSKQFRQPGLFPSARSERVAVLVVPFLSEKEAEAVQKMVGGLPRKSGKGDSYRADCFFTRSSVPGKFNGWLYLSDL